MTYARDPYDTDQPPCVCPLEAGPVLTTEEFCPAHGDPGRPAPEEAQGAAQPHDHATDYDADTCPLCFPGNDACICRCHFSDAAMGAYDMAPGQ
jgi:hypothetical protein